MSKVEGGGGGRLTSSRLRVTIFSSKFPGLRFAPSSKLKPNKFSEYFKRSF